MKMTEITKKHWNKIGAGYDKYWLPIGKQALLKKELNFIDKYLISSKPKTALDIGIGTGRILNNYLNHHFPKDINGIDISSTMVNLCRRKFNQNNRIRKLAVCNIATQPLIFDKKYDFITAIRVLKYIPNWKSSIKKIVNHLNPGGVFIFSIPNSHSYINFTRPDTKEYYSAENELKKAIANLDIDLTEITTFSKIPDTVYNLVKHKSSLHLLMSWENYLKKALNNHGGKEFFVALRKLA